MNQTAIATATSMTERVRDEYEAPALQCIGEAARVILGFPGGGADGPYGMTEPIFEFEDDGDGAL